VRAGTLYALGSPDPAWLESRYETLRMAALGEPVLPEYRSGLAIFLRRGMWGWGRVRPSEVVPEPRPQRSSPGSTGPDQHGAVVRVFAAMAMVRKNREER
jgi:hypothetical protein